MGKAILTVYRRMRKPPQNRRTILKMHKRKMCPASKRKRSSKMIPLLLIGVLLLSACANGGGRNPQSSQDVVEKKAEPSGAAPSEGSSAPMPEISDTTGETAGETTAASLSANSKATIELSSLEHYTESDDAPEAYFISDITPEAMVRAYEALQWSPTGTVAVKLSTGEPPASNYLRPELIADLVQMVEGTIVECNTAYGGSRASAAMHYQVAEDHGFTAIADVKIQDEDGSTTLPVEGGARLSENYVGAAFADYDSYLVLSHFKGHAMAGFGRAIKNISIGLGSGEGKAWIHSGGTSRTSAWGGEIGRASCRERV